MTLRRALLVLALVALAGAVWCVATTGFGWPLVVWALIAAAALGAERTLYGAATARLPGPGWRATGECFIDDASGRPIEVWIDPATGERRYIDRGAGTR